MSENEESKVTDLAAELNVENMSDSEVDNFFTNAGNEQIEDENSTDENEKEVKEEEPKIEEKEIKNVDSNKNSALQEARKENRLLQKQLQELADKNDKLLKTFEGAFAENKKEPEIPSYEDDPIGHLKYKNELLEKKLEGLNKFKDMSTQEKQQFESHTRFVNTYRQQCNEFAATTPDFSPAYDYVLQSRFNEYKAVGHTDTEAANLVREDEQFIASKALVDGVNPAERIYALAKLRGYKENSMINGQSQKSSGQPGKSGSLADATAKIDQIKRGQQASRTLNDTGSNPGNKLTLADIAALPDREFEKIDWENDVLIYG